MDTRGYNFPSGLLVKDQAVLYDNAKWKLIEGYPLSGKSGLSYALQFCLLRESPPGAIPVCRISTEKDAFSLLGSIKAAMVDCGLQHGLAIIESETIYSKYFSISLDLGIFPAQDLKGQKLSNDETKETLKYRQFPKRIKRDRVSMMADIMSFLYEESGSITSIIYRCNLNYQTAIGLLDELLEKKYVTMVYNRNKPLYSLTKDGLDALRSIRK